ncbi:biopolymer transporter ExbD [Telmatospirillum sp. J64-1]|uniref:ExbD/TolR family protein n=1 Tax=Telmatospirillum sp. J64-1 TaxID=2502183 RepID=UPI00115D47D9|nr:biopolymer transporter ExbD [Telmatospirillum sp. J64-1]
MRLHRPSRTRQLVSLTPLIDVVFILLVFFMLASSFNDWRGLSLSSPAQVTSRSAANPALLVRVTQEGIIIEDRTLDAAGFETELQKILQTTPDRRVILRPEDQVALQRIVEVMDQAAALGATNVSLSRP